MVIMVASPRKSINMVFHRVGVCGFGESNQKRRNHLKDSPPFASVYFLVSRSLLPDYQQLLSSMPSHRLNSSKLVENSEAKADAISHMNTIVNSTKGDPILMLKELGPGKGKEITLHGRGGNKKK
ncbi:hypothetical protein LOK49_LG14G00922 [Camellia lanceoleosa]|uniref:Uncharacterized protein n=1 Tax=Camellia lanceoleosa TaxID=1840588 RepID=A0ACC0FFI3_9ERIC|nr:hypothetical protein LOK49_LG14G00922 [Camellia lanceoleosa]